LHFTEPVVTAEAGGPESSREMSAGRLPRQRESFRSVSSTEDHEAFGLCLRLVMCESQGQREYGQSGESERTEHA
jgi:hypothetical protein